MNQLFRMLQKEKLEGHGEYTVMVSDLTDEPPVPVEFGSLKISENQKEVVLQSITLDQLMTKLRNRFQTAPKLGKC